MKKYKTYLIYHLKWQLGILVSWPCMWLLKDVLGWSNFWTIIGFQFIGALIFWNIDKHIFKHDKQTKSNSDNNIS
jgi:hypothetical protein